MSPHCNGDPTDPQGIGEYLRFGRSKGKREGPYARQDVKCVFNLQLGFSVTDIVCR